MSQWFQKQERCPSIEPGERGFQYGDGLFETVAIRGGEPRLWDYHMERLQRGCERLGILAPDRGTLRDELQETLMAGTADTAFCVAKIVVTAGTGQRGYGRIMPTDATTYCAVSSSVPLEKSVYQSGVTTIVCQTRLATGSPLAGLKTLNRLEQVLARSECLPPGAFEGLTLDAEGRLVCGTMSNVFIVRNQVIRTPSLRHCGVEGVMRRHLLHILRKANTRVEVCDLDGDDIGTADELFITNSQMGAVPVCRCDSYQWPVGELTRGIMAALAAAGIDECRV